MKKFIIINGKYLALIEKENMKDAVMYCQNYCNHSEEIKAYAREHFEAMAKCSAVSDRQRNDVELMKSINDDLINKLEIINRI